MKLFASYLKSKRKPVALFFVFAAILTVSFALFHLPLEAVVYPLIICSVIGLIVFFTGYTKTKHIHEELTSLTSVMSDMIELPESCETIAEHDLREIILSLKKENASLRSEEDIRFRDMVDYYTAWAHQIKTPIASARLLLESEDSELSRKLETQIARMQHYVSMVMAFLRIGSDSTDYVFRKCSVDEIIRESVKNFSSEFILRKLSLDYTQTELEIVTDRKWFSFMFEQLLSNALKYTRIGTIKIYSSGNMLYLIDTGIGIRSEDLPRIFEKGYTGFNGRINPESSGLGLYLVKNICDSLGTGIEIKSEEGEGTEVILDLSQKSL